ncbi:hypothetical protein AM493_12220 [Flavobacterium akiainvivens]|uniref:Uncharacterized protein n=1 Tax=Flavobacterium akiainvivens TaxID=1202724 RepID=A0A0M9VII8_9FLAO|nr:hypothetical protein AM493_12220 [Flavobacterium akiainvivens]SFQ71168.1 hypothetical protein SAMN05444144_11686 [Flavobacterium akiainvivens]
MNYKKVCLLSFITVLFLFIVTSIIYDVSTQFKIRDIFSSINLFAFVLLFPTFYLTIFSYDIANRNLLLSSILHYILIVLSVVYFIYYFFFDSWAGAIAIYFVLAALLNIIVMSIVKKYKLEDSVSLKIQWISVSSWILLILLFFVISTAI